MIAEGKRGWVLSSAREMASDRNRDLSSIERGRKWPLMWVR